jgi:hypothetical protein
VGGKRQRREDQSFDGTRRRSKRRDNADILRAVINDSISQHPYQEIGDGVNHGRFERDSLEGQLIVPPLLYSLKFVKFSREY